MLTVLKSGLEATRLVSAERGPTNGLLGEALENQASWRARLDAARVATDKALFDYRTLVGKLPETAAAYLSAQIADTVGKLALRRKEIDAVAVQPLWQRTPEHVISGMIDLVMPALMRSCLQLGSIVVEHDQSLADDVFIALASSELREYAGQVGSRLVVGLFRPQGLDAERLRVIDQLTGRIFELRHMIEARLGGHRADASQVATIAELDRNYFSEGLGLVDSLRGANSGASAPTTVAPGAFTDQYIPKMRSIEAVRDMSLLRAQNAARSKRIDDLNWLMACAGSVALVFGVLGFTGAAVHRYLLVPLIATTRELNNLAAGRLDGASLTGRYPGEVDEMLEAVSVLRGFMARRKALEDEREMLLDKVKEMAETDHLTGLPNRRLFESAVSLALKRGEAVAVILCDVDHFKKINDRFGHKAGDDALRTVGERLRSALRGTDMVFRYGGEEFAVIVRNFGDHAPTVVAERLRDCVERVPVTIEGEEIVVSISAGVAWVAPGERGVDLADLVARADRALYQAKRDGRNRVRIDGGSQLI